MAKKQNRDDIYPDIRNTIQYFFAAFQIGKQFKPKFVSPRLLDDVEKNFLQGFESEDIIRAAKQAYFDPWLGDAIDATEEQKNNSYDLSIRMQATVIAQGERTLPPNYENDYPGVTALIQGIKEAREELKKQTLPKNIFDDPRARETLRRNFFYSVHTHPVKYGSLFDDIANYATTKLSDDADTQRAHEGKEKYQALVQLMQRIQGVDDIDTQKRLIKVRNILKAALEQNTDKSELLKNRGGFFGAYKTFSKCLAFFKAADYSFQDRAAVSSTDHLLIKLYNDVSSRIEPPKPGEASRVEVLPDDYEEDSRSDLRVD